MSQAYIDVIAAHLRGEPIEHRPRGGSEETWMVISNPVWDFRTGEYRVAPLTLDTINWSHVAPEWRWLARDADGEAYLHTKAPDRSLNEWISGVPVSYAPSHVSYKAGTISWDKSLIKRPAAV